ncbi:MAG: DNA-binding transcriptional regulator Fis [Gammaproteobacteria bacterium]
MQKKHSMQPLRDHALDTLQTYFDHMGDHEISDLYTMVLQEIEIPLLQIVLQKTKGNRSKAAEMLGLNRSTLRKKLNQYELL